MPLTIASVFNFIPTQIWRPLKKFVTQDQLIVYDLPFKISTKYTPGLLLVFMCLSFANQFVRNIELDCTTNGVLKGTQNGYGTSDTEKGLNDFCWNHETFLVARALQPKMRGLVTYPGVSSYNKSADELVRQRYHKYIWLIFGQLAFVSFLPYFLWKARGIKKVKPLVSITHSVDYSEEDQRMNYFLETIGLNDSFSWTYIFCKICATLSPLGQWYYLCGFLGKHYKYYGIDVLRFFIDDSDPWPNPMDVLFPKMAKCEWSHYGYSFDMEIKSAQCQLPMNNITQWSFFLFWIWIAVIFVVNILSCLYLFLHIFPCFRRHKYRKFVAVACRDDVEKLRNYLTVGHSGNKIKKKHEKSKVISINMSFGDWLVLSFIKKNLEEWKFRDFIRQLATTENVIIQLMPVKSVSMSIPTLSTLNEMSVKENADDVDGHKAANMDIGFKQAIINPNGDIGFKQSLMNQLQSPAFDLSDSFLSGEDSVKITPPVKIDRKNLSRTSGKASKKNSKAAVPQMAHGGHANYGWNPKAQMHPSQITDQETWD